MPETPKTKAELFAEDPDRFQDMADVEFAVIRHKESGVLGHCINLGLKGETVSDVYEEALKLQAFCNRKINGFMDGLDRAIADNKKTNGLVKPNGFLNGIRNMGTRH